MTIHRSPFADVPIPTVSITELVFAGLNGREDEPAVIEGPTGRILTGAELSDRIRRLAGGLKARGFGPGRVLAILSPNTPEFIVAHAAAWAGGSVTTINPSYTPEEIRHQLRDSRAELLVTVPALLDAARAGAEGASVAEIVVIGAAPGATPLDALMDEALPTQTPVDTATHIVALPYSSGTTGLPKGVMLAHRNLVANVVQVARIIPIAPGAPTLAFLPYFHVYGLTVMMNLYLARGGLQVTLPRFELEAALGLIETHRIRHLFVAPPVVLALAKHPAVDRFDLASLDFVLSGAAPLGADLAAACAARIGCPTI